MAEPKYKQEIRKCWSRLLSGTVLAIDPSTGSSGSMPGYAIFKQGELVESGIIQVNPADRRNQKLYSITKSLKEEFEEPDILVIENVPPVQFRGGKMSPWSIVAIQRAIGAIISVFNCEYIEIAPKAWQKYKPEGYKKSDEWDAIAIGNCVICVAKEIKHVSDMAMGEERVSE